MQTDVYFKELPTRLDAATVRTLSELKEARSLTQVAFEWASIFAAIFLSLHVYQSTGNLWLYVPAYILAVVWIGTRQHALGVLLHEAVHYRLCKNRKLNDFIGEWLLAWPLLISLVGYRKQHYTHHHTVGEDNDPDYARIRGVAKYTFPKTKKQLIIIFTKYMLGAYAAYDGKEAMEQLVVGIPKSLHIKRALLYIAFIAAAIYGDFWLETLIYWNVPASTSLFLFMYIRLVAEHSAMPKGDSVFTRTRHMDPTWWERILIAPNGVNYHLDHHLYPSVPFYNLPKLHDTLMRDDAYKNGAHITKGYFSGLLWNECINFKA